jgi:NAD(P)H-flavin reductase/ferredoxin
MPTPADETPAESQTIVRPGQARGSRLRVNGRHLDVQPRETILQAALRSGIDFPNSCRVGGCGTCKCKVTSGSVKELTETGYLLTQEELEAGFVLACQSLPRGDVDVEVELTERATRRRVGGRITARASLTHDIVALKIALEEPLLFRAGQFAHLSIEGLEGVARSYSFSAPAAEDGVIEFFVRKVPGGRMSSLIVDEDVVGRRIELDGPAGDFWLRAGEAPLLLVAGGSGLAPILSLLRGALAEGCTRAVTLVFGAREERDLYCLAEIQQIASAWPGRFRFVPVLSAAAPDAAWSGARGLVTDILPDLLEPGAHAYLCGPLGMIDGALGLLESRGIPREHVHFDRFTTQADVAAATQASETMSGRSAQDAGSKQIVYAGVLDYLKYFLFHGIGLFAALALVLGGAYVTVGLVSVVVIYMLGDALLGDDRTTPTFSHPRILTWQLWLALPLLSCIVFTAVWGVSSGDPMGFGAAVQALTGYDALAARAATGVGHRVSAWILTGLMIGMVGTITAHELTHRTWDPVSMFIGRWLLAFSFDTTFAIEHVYGHHRYVSTVKDPATAPRGRNVYYHIIASTLKGNRSAWHIERDRLRKKKLQVWSRHNAFLRGHLMSVALVVAAGLLGGPVAAAFFLACALWGKALLEIVNYMEHYGMVRSPATPVQPRHSWNTNRRISSWAMFNLTRHSHHHAQGEVPYQDLEPYPDAPMMINGYLTTIIVALIPPLWHSLMNPKVLAWDREYATAEERLLAAQANARSGLRRLRQANPGGDMGLTAS